MIMKIDENGDIFLEDGRGAYGRGYEAWIGRFGCSVCGKTDVGLATDGSEGEYGGPAFCGGCLKKIILALESWEGTPGPGFRFVCNEIDIEKFLAAGWKIQPGVAQGGCPGMTIEGPALK
jgi:hypothetical protein